MYYQSNINVKAIQSCVSLVHHMQQLELNCFWLLIFFFFLCETTSRPLKCYDIARCTVESANDRFICYEM